MCLAKNDKIWYNISMKVGDCMQRYFVKKENIFGNNINIDGDDHYHITKVMRMKIGDKIIACDNHSSWLVQIDSFTNDRVITTIIEELNEKKELPVKITIAHGLVRREKMEEVIDKITQLGASFYQPVVMEFCNVKYNDDKIEKKLERMNKIAKEASEQSHRTHLLEVLKPIHFKDFLKRKDEFDLCLYAYEVVSKDQSLKKVLQTKGFQNILILIGPEGGISEKEASRLNELNFIPVSLGPRILRTEVAPTYVLTAISYELEG